MAKQQLDGTSRGLERSPASGEQALTPVDEAGGSDELGGGVVGLIVVGTLLLAVLLAFRLYRMTQWWASRARSAKVLDEIEMEFVNDMDMDEELLRNTLPSDLAPRQREASGDWVSIDPSTPSVSR